MHRHIVIGSGLVFMLAATWACNKTATAPTKPKSSTNERVAKAADATTQASTTQPAEELTLDLGNKVAMKLVLIPPGKFVMGSPDDEKDRSVDEGPQHEVTISKPFYMGVYPVTNEQYEQVMLKNPSQFKWAACPVEMVSWDDAVEFCKALSKKTGETVSLPTEAQWEYACRAGSTTRFFYGDDNDYASLDDYAWYLKSKTASPGPVGQKKPNNWGLYDMHGNVWEWCADWYAADYVNATNVDPQGPASGKFRVIRGGGWNNHSLLCRSASRFNVVPDFRGGSALGFRVIVVLGN